MRDYRPRSKYGPVSMGLLFELFEAGYALKDLLTKKRLQAGLQEAKKLNPKAVSSVLVSKKIIQGTLTRLKKKGFINLKNGTYTITHNGRELLNELKNEYQWDGKWRMVLFDIPEKKRMYRKRITAILVRLAYRQLQKSVYIGQRPLEEDFIKDLMKWDLYRNVRIITIGDIDDESVLFV